MKGLSCDGGKKQGRQQKAQLTKLISVKTVVRQFVLGFYRPEYRCSREKSGLIIHPTVRIDETRDTPDRASCNPSPVFDCPENRELLMLKRTGHPAPPAIDRNDGNELRPLPDEGGDKSRVR